MRGTLCAGDAEHSNLPLLASICATAFPKPVGSVDAVRHAAAAYQALSQGAASKRRTHSFDMGALPSVPELNVQQIPTRASNEVQLVTLTCCLSVSVIQESV